MGRFPTRDSLPANKKGMIVGRCAADGVQRFIQGALLIRGEGLLVGKLVEGVRVFLLPPRHLPLTHSLPPSIIKPICFGRVSDSKSPPDLIWLFVIGGQTASKGRAIFLPHFHSPLLPFSIFLHAKVCKDFGGRLVFGVAGLNRHTRSVDCLGGRAHSTEISAQSISVYGFFVSTVYFTEPPFPDIRPIQIRVVVKVEFEH
ncbi:hypothetical protein SUGI_0803390 [Cryptomeria japonica]|nr:hypothetical protein SUGI_0803390 [Cryptomeria japonica]